MGMEERSTCSHLILDLIMETQYIGELPECAPVQSVGIMTLDFEEIKKKKIDHSTKRQTKDPRFPSYMKLLM